MDDSKKDDYNIQNTSNSICNEILDYKNADDGNSSHSFPSSKTQDKIAKNENNITSICEEEDAKNSDEGKAESRSTSSSVDENFCWVLRTENARGRRWQDVGPLTLSLLKHELQRQHPQLPELTPANARLVCSLSDSLSLQLCALGSADLLWLFSDLEHLDLSNNFLTEVQGICHLTKLTRLNLSYNQLPQVPDLSRLERLEVLSLQGNRISALPQAAIHGLPVQVFNLSENRLSEQRDIISLRSLIGLRSVNLRDNPICEGQSHHPLALALLPNLLYLDGSRPQESDRQKATLKYQNLLKEVEGDERATREAATEESQRRDAAAHHERAGVQHLDDGSLFRSLVQGDVEAKVLLGLPGADKLLTRYRDQVGAVCGEVFSSGMQHDLQRQQELQLLQESLAAAYDAADQKAKGRVRDLADRVREAEALLGAIDEEERNSTRDDQEEVQARVLRAEAVKEEADALLEEAAYALLEEEVVLADQVTDVFQRADSELRTLVTGFLVSAGDQFQEARTLAYTFYCGLRELSTRFASSPALLTLFRSPFGSGELDEVLEKESGSVDLLPDSKSLEEVAARVFEGEDTLASSLASLHDRHLCCIRAREERLMSHLKQWLEGTVRDLHTREWRRHRSRLHEINSILDGHRQSIHNALVPILQLADC